jgi:hypothetical protein
VQAEQSHPMGMPLHQPCQHDGSCIQTVMGIQLTHRSMLEPSVSAHLWDLHNPADILWPAADRTWTRVQNVQRAAAVCSICQGCVQERRPAHLHRRTRDNSLALLQL